MISVCMATYNGEEFVQEQLSSVLSQLAENDEVIIVDDCSSDGTVQIIRSYADARIQLRVNKNNIGPIRSFEKAICLSKGDYIFLSDQDDVWLPNKVLRVEKVFKNCSSSLIIHDASVTDAKLNVVSSSWNRFNHNYFGRTIPSTIFKNSYTGSMMAFNREILPEILPFPQQIVMHDWWIALCCIKNKRKITTLSDKLMLYRRHLGNVTGKRQSIFKMIRDRWRMLMAIS